MRTSKIIYDETLTPAQNAKKNGVTIEGIRYYIKTRGIDRHHQRSANIVDKIKDYLKKNPNAKKVEVSKKAKISINTVRKYWDVAKGEKKLSEISRKRPPKKKFDDLDIHPYVIWDILHAEDFTDEITEPFYDADSPVWEVMRKSGKNPIKPDNEILDDYKPKKKCDVVSVLPYTDDIHVVVQACLDICKKKVALFMPLRFLSGEESFKGILKKHPPVRIYQNTSDMCRAKPVKVPKYSQSEASGYVWCVWEKGYKGATQFKWMENRQKPIYKTADIDEIEILGGLKFKPNEWHRYPLKECIQFHSKAEPENQVMSNHYDCIINFKGIEFHGVEQMYFALQFKDSPDIFKGLMQETKPSEVKSFCKPLDDYRDWDADAHCYRHIALCHFYKYLSFKPYRDRLRETYPHDLVECPLGHDDDYGAVQNLETNIFEGYNCSGRTTMAVRDMMVSLENKAVEKETKRKGRELSEEERETVYEALYAQMRQKMDNDETVIKDTKKIIELFKMLKIPKARSRHPEYKAPPVKDRETKCLILDFDYTLFDTSADDGVRKSAKGEKNWEKDIYPLIPQYRLYDGWREVFDWAKENNIKIGIISEAKRELVEMALEHFNLKCDVVIGYRPYYEKPCPILVDFAIQELNVAKENMVSIGSTITDEVMSRAGNIRFVGALWDGKEAEELKKRGKTIDNPLEIKKLFNTHKKSSQSTD
jgi:predicted HAD superfamily phosphohydrolase YqeG/predicted NAD-dependent protein-ADP-ribosyltransferase YbiA (DUF1768 family)